MPDDPIFVALQQNLGITLDVVIAAKKYRFAQIDELWEQIRILERLIDAYPGGSSVLAERDPPLETAKRPYH